MTHSPLTFMILVNVLLILVGCVMDSGPAIMILTPILLPIAKSFGLDPIYFGVVMVANLCIGLATPPVGNVLYCGVSLSKVKLSVSSMPACPLSASCIWSCCSSPCSPS